MRDIAAQSDPFAPFSRYTCRRRVLRLGLAKRVLILVATFVMTAEVMIYVPSMSIYHDNWLRSRLSAGYTAALVLEAAPHGMIPASLSNQLLDSVPARIIVLQDRGTRRILAASEMPLRVDDTYDLRDPSWGASLAATVGTLLAPKGRVLTIYGAAPMGGDAVEITMDEAALKRAMHSYSLRLLNLSLIVSLIVATFAMAAIHFMVLAPVRRLTTSIVEFEADPEDSSRIIVPSGSKHEIGEAEEALAIMQDTLARELHQKKHLAALGLAVAKINHDLRNMLASAQLLSDRLANVTDPLAQRVAPKLVATLDRAIRFCQATLTYGRATDDPPNPRPLMLRGLVTEVIETLPTDGVRKIEIVNDVEENCEIVADDEQMFRILMNLARNSVEALQSAGPAPGRPARVVIRAHLDQDRNAAIIEVADTGPGIPDTLRPKLFAAFVTSTRRGGTGLGLAIAADLVRAHKGSITLLPQALEVGTTFRIALPVDAFQPGWGGDAERPLGVK
jgi:signal transduction histidine kinase